MGAASAWCRCGRVPLGEVGTRGCDQKVNREHDHDELVAKVDDNFGLEQGNDYGGGYAWEREGKGVDAHNDPVDVQSGLGEGSTALESKTNAGGCPR